MCVVMVCEPLSNRCTVNIDVNSDINTRLRIRLELNFFPSALDLRILIFRFFFFFLNDEFKAFKVKQLHVHGSVCVRV